MSARVVGGDQLRRQLDRLSRQSSHTVLDALKRLAFDVRDDVREHVGDALSWSGPGTRRFIAGGFRLQQKRSGDRFTMRIYPAPRSAEILSKHVDRFTNVPGHGEDITVLGRIAIPVGRARRNRSGRVPRTYQPVELLNRGANGKTRGFISRDGREVMLRRRGADPEPVFALRGATTQPARVDVRGAARRSVRMRAGKAFARAIRSAMRKSGLKPS